MSHGEQTHFVVVQGNLTVIRYRDEVLQPHVVSLIRARSLKFRQDNEKPHLQASVATSWIGTLFLIGYPTV